MITALLVLHLLVTLTLIATVLVQRSEGGGLGIGSSQGMGSFMSGRGTANLLTRTTGILAALFMALSLALAVLNRGNSGRAHDILGLPAATAPVPGAALPLAPVAPPSSQIPGATPGLVPAPSSVPAPIPAPGQTLVPGRAPVQTTVPAPVPAPPIPGH